MKHNLLRAIPVLLALAAGANAQPRFTADNQLIRPKDYREWVYLTSGLGMSYGPMANQMSDSSPVFDNVFVNPASYKAFLATGKWPDKTIFILEIRSSASHGSINKNGHFQTDVAAVEAAVKDEAHIPDKWGYFGFSEKPGALADSAKIFPKSAGCFGCHTANGAVDNTFVQFYPTLLEVAQAKGTVNASYHPVPTPAKFFHVISEQGWDKGQAVFEQVKASDPDADIAKESALNRVGYQLLSAGKKVEAVAVLKLATVNYPASCNAQDSLAEMYEANGQKDLAIAASEKAIELAAADSKVGADRKQRVVDGAKQRIAKLRGQ